MVQGVLPEQSGSHRDGRVARTFAAAALLVTLTGAAPKPDAALEADYSQARASFQALLSHPSKARLRDPYERLIDRFTKIEREDKNGALAHRAAFMAARVAEELSKASRVPQDLDDAMRRMRAVADRYPNSRLADDALLYAARMALERRGDVDGARETLGNLLSRYPRGDMIGQAKELHGRLPPKEPRPTARSAGTTSGTAPTSAAPEASQKPGEDDDPSDDPDADQPVDRIGELLTKAKLIRSRAGETDAPDAEVLEAEASLQQVEAISEGPSSKKLEPPLVEVPPRPADMTPKRRPASKERPARVARVTVQEAVQGLEIVVALDADVQVKVGEAPAVPKRNVPRRVYFDLTPAKLDPTAYGTTTPKNPQVSRVRAGQFTLTTARIVLELKGEATPGTPRHCLEGLCVTVHPKAPPPVVATPVVGTKQTATPPKETTAGVPAKEKVAAAPKKEAAAKPTHPPNRDMLPRHSSADGLSLSQQVGLTVKTVVLDPGHGGRDPGAIGPTGLREKDVTLRLAKRIAKRLRDELGVKVVLTRESDKYLSLEQRTEIANKAHADLFISLHVNASPNGRAYGIETFYLNTTDDRYAIRLAARENAGSEKSIGDLQFILADLVTKSNVEDSQRLAKAVQGGVLTRVRSKYNRVKDLGLKHALFYVLIGVRMPSILVEASFISHRREEKRLRQAAYLDAIADGVVGGVRSFVETQKASDAS